MRTGVQHSYIISFFLPWYNSPQWIRAPSLSRIQDHIQTHHTRKDSSGRVISPTQRPLPDNTQHLQQADFHAPGGIQTHNSSKTATTNPHLRSGGHWDRHIISYMGFIFPTICRHIYIYIFFKVINAETLQKYSVQPHHIQSTPYSVQPHHIQSSPTIFSPAPPTLYRIVLILVCTKNIC